MSLQVCCINRPCGCYDARSVIDHLQQAHDRTVTEALELRDRWRACVDTIDAARLVLNDEATRVYVARSAHAHLVSLAPQFGYVNAIPNVPWAEVPAATRELLVTAAGHVLRDLLDRLDLGRNP